MVEPLTRGGVYLARLDSAKGAEVGKMRPVVVLTEPTLLAVDPPVVFVCPLSSQSESRFAALHVALPARDRLLVESFALVEHCRAISRSRILSERLSQISEVEIEIIAQRLLRLIGL